jgi:plasmid stability protein
MSDITIHQLEPALISRLEQCAAQHGHTIEAEIKAILHSVLNPKPATQINLSMAIDQRFAHLGDFDIPETEREPIRKAPNFGSIEV